MRKSLRLASLALASLAALAFTSVASAAYAPRLVVAPSSHAVGGGGPMTFNIDQAEAHDATFRIEFNAPPRYVSSLPGGAVGSSIGSVRAVILARALGGAKVPVTGAVRVDDPAKHTSNLCSPGTHQAVWLLELSAAGQTLLVPVYVDQVTSGPTASFSSLKIVACLPSPYVPPPVGASLGAQLLQATFTVNGIFTNPAARGEYRWTGLFTPWTPGTATPNLAGTVQAQTSANLPVQLTLSGRYFKKTSSARLGGSLTENGQGVAGVRLRLLAGKKASGLKAVGFTSKTNADGSYTVTRKSVLQTTFFQTRGTVAARNVTTAGCVPALAPCVNVWTAPFSVVSNIVKVSVPK